MGLKQRVLAVVRSRRLLAASGIFSAAIVCVAVNVLVHRFYRRWDVTSNQLFSLSTATLETLHGLQEPVDVLVFLGHQDPLLSATRKLLTSYQAETRWLNVQHVDPDDNPAQFLALQRKYDLVEGKTEDGRLASDAMVVMARGDHSWFVTADDVVSVEPDQGSVAPRLEQAFTEGLRQVLGGQTVEVCFTTGHGETSAARGGATGLSELKYRLEKDNYRVREVNLAATAGSGALSGCRLVIVAGPKTAFSDAATAKLVSHLTSGGSLGLFVPPVFDDDGRATSVGLGQLTALLGVSLGESLIVETEPERVVAVGWGGEVFLAGAREHAITKGLTTAAPPGFVQIAMSRELSVAADARGVSILTTSAKAGAVTNLQSAFAEGSTLQAVAARSGEEKVVASATELSGAAEPGQKRALVVGSLSPILSNVWRDPRLINDKIFIESAIAWLTAAPPIVSVPEKAAAPAGLSLSQEDYANVVRYVLLYMPGTALLLGALVMVRRRQKLPRNRRGNA